VLVAPAVEEVLETRLLAVGAIAVFQEDAQDGVGHLHAAVGRDDDTAVAGEVAVAGDAAEAQPEPDARRDGVALPHPHRGEADVVRVLEDAHRAAAVEADVELARQPVQLAVVEDVVVERARERTGVDELLRIDAGGGAAGDVAHVVGAGAARDDAELVQRGEDLDAVFGGDAAELEVGARRHVREPDAEPLGELGDAAELVRGDYAARQPQAAHERLLRRCDVEQSVKLPAEDVDALRKAPFPRVLLHAIPGVERVLGALGLLLGAELLPLGEEAVLSAEVDELRAGGRGRRGGRGSRGGRGRRGGRGGRQPRDTPEPARHRGQSTAGTSRIHPAQEAAEVALLLVCEVRIVAHAVSPGSRRLTLVKQGVSHGGDPPRVRAVTSEAARPQRRNAARACPGTAQTRSPAGPLRHAFRAMRDPARGPARRLGRQRGCVRSSLRAHSVRAASPPVEQEAVLRAARPRGRNDGLGRACARG